MKGQELYEEGKRLIPQGSLYSKRGELHAPGQWPQYFDKSRGIEITDISGQRYLDFSGASVGSCLLGYRDEDVDQSVIRAISKGSTSALNAPEEVELAKILCTIHPWASAARFTRSGGEAMAVAVRIAQTCTSRYKVLTGSYHGWHFNDPTNNNFPLHPDVHYLSRAPIDTSVAAVVVEPSRLTEPEPGYLEGLKQRCYENGALLIFDEISSGFRRNLGGVHLQYGVTPDLAVFSKAMSNGYPMGAVIGTEEAMDACKYTFISSTCWSERIGPAAAIATIMKLWRDDPYDHVEYVGELVQNTMRYEAKRHNVQLEVSGPSAMTHYKWDSPVTQTLFCQYMLENGFLVSSDFYPMVPHTIDHIESFREAVVGFYRDLPSLKLKGPTIQAGVKR